MHKLFLNKRYDDVVELFDKQIDFFGTERSYSFDTKDFARQDIPFDQLTCVVAALMTLVNIKIKKKFPKRNSAKNCLVASVDSYF